MNLPEYKASAIFRERGIDYPMGEVAGSAEEAGVVAAKLGCRKFVVKAQVAAGGRGKAGGVVFASSPREVESAAYTLLTDGMKINGEGRPTLPVPLVMVQEYVETSDQFYISVTMQSGEDYPVALFSLQGGVDIEELSEKSPGSIRKTRLDPYCGFRSYQLRRLLGGFNLPGSTRRSVEDVAVRMAALMLEEEAILAEINPLGITPKGKVYGLDAKIILDDNAAFRHPGRYRPDAGEKGDYQESMAAEAGISYVRLEGNIGCMVNGAGLAMEVMDLIGSEGGTAANFLDVGGGADRERITRALDILLTDSRIRTVLVNIFGGILRCDLVADALVGVFLGRDVPWPVVVRLKGNRQMEAASIIRKSGIPFIIEDDLLEAVRRAIELAIT